MKSSLKLRGMVFTAIMAAVICIAAPFAIPLPSAVPLSLATLAVYLAGALLGKIRGTLAAVIYILIGLAGMPVFSGFTGGIAQLAGVTGGYIIGYIPCALLTGLFADIFGGKAWAVAAGASLGTLALYAFGTAWFILFTGSELPAALLGCVAPFLAGDVIKIAAATAAAVPLRRKLAGVLQGSPVRELPYRKK